MLKKSNEFRNNKSHLTTESQGRMALSYVSWLFQMENEGNIR